MDNEKEYKKLVGKIKKAYLYAQTDSTKAVLEDILPELKESKDEKIRKVIYDRIYLRPSQFFDDGFSKEEMLAWLEKQDKSKKYIFKSIPRLLDMIEPTERAKAYTKKLINTLTEEGYITDAKIVEECLKQMNGEHVAMAVMNEKRGEQILANSAKTGKDEQKPVYERIKTFDDARQELNTKALSGDETAAILLADYESNADNIMSPQISAYMRLAIIAYALNEGWEPKFEKGEYRYFPWFYLYNKEQYDELDIEEKERYVLRSGVYMSSYFGFVSVYASYDASVSSPNNGSRLVFRTRELAAYAGRQFIKEWADFVFKPE